MNALVDFYEQPTSSCELFSLGNPLSPDYEAAVSSAEVADRADELRRWLRAVAPQDQAATHVLGQKGLAQRLPGGYNCAVMESLVKLQNLARAVQVSPITLERWLSAAILRGTNRGRGPGNGIVFTRDQAFEALALLSLRRAGVPLQRLRPLVRDLRRRGWAGSDFLQLGANGKALLVDGHGAGSPLRDPRTGQMHLALVLDLRAMRAQAEQLIAALVRRGDHAAA